MAAIVIFNFLSFEYFFEKIHPLPARRGSFTYSRYRNGELHIELDIDVTGQNCGVIGTIAPPDSNLVEYSQLVHTLKQAGAAQVIAILPYLAYARHDKERPGQSLGMAWTGELLQASGIDRVFAIDVHSSHDATLLPMPLVNILPNQLWADEIGELSGSDVTLVAPDKGAIRRCQAAADAAGIIRPVAYLEKQRRDGIAHLNLIGELTGRAVIVDDILDTGSTLVSCVQKLLGAGVGDITIAVSHGLFTGTAWHQLWDLGVERLYCLDTVPAARQISDPHVRVVSCSTSIYRQIMQEKQQETFHNGPRSGKFRQN